MSFEIEQKAPCRVALTATIPTEDVSETRSRLLASFTRNARIPGFRKGKAPRAMVERRFAKEIAEELQEELLHRSWDQVREERELKAAGPLEVKKAEMLDDGSFSMEGEFEVYPEITLTDPDTFTPPEVVVEPSEEEVDQALAKLRDRQAVWEPVEEGAAEEGMLVEVSLHGEMPDGGGDPFDEERSLFQIGGGEVFPEIEAAVTGHAAGDEVTAERTLGDEAGEALAGKRVAYTIRIKSLRRKRLPELDDAFAKSFGVEDGLEELRRRLVGRIRIEKAFERRRVWRDALVEHLRGGGEVALPERATREKVREEILEFAHALASRGVDPEKADVEWEKVEAEMRERVERTFRSELILDALATRLGVEVTDDQVDAELRKEADRRSVPFAELKGNLTKDGRVEGIRDVLRRENAVDQVLGRFGKEA